MKFPFGPFDEWRGTGQNGVMNVADPQALLTTVALPGRLRQVLHYAGCLTIAEALSLTPAQLLRFPQAGTATLQAMLDFLVTGLQVQDLKRSKQMHRCFAEILGLATENESLVDLGALRSRRISDAEIDREASKFAATHTQSSRSDAFRRGARLARQWQARLLATSQKITPVILKAVCGHEYKTGILHVDEEDFREQRAVLATLKCLACVEETEGIHGQVILFGNPSETMATAETPALRIISGGQTGADRAALDWAIRHNVPHGGYCPKGRRAEDGMIPAHYQLEELASANYQARTKRNVEAADGTVIFTIQETMMGGTLLTAQHAHKQGKPLLHLCRTQSLLEAAKQLQEFLGTHEIRVLNVAGPRASKEPAIGDFVTGVLDAWSVLAASEE